MSGYFTENDVLNAYKSLSLMKKIKNRECLVMDGYIKDLSKFTDGLSKITTTGSDIIDAYELLHSIKEIKNFVFVSSPLKPYGKYTLEDNIKTARKYCREVVLTGDIPIAPHVYFPNFLDDFNPVERKLGFDCGIELLSLCNRMNMYILNGYISEGMRKEMKIAKDLDMKINKIYVHDFMNLHDDYCNH